jgi:hypothetical protein
MEGYCSTGQSPQQAVVPVEEEEEEEGEGEGEEGEGEEGGGEEEEEEEGGGEEEGEEEEEEEVEEEEEEEKKKKRRRRRKEEEEEEEEKWGHETCHPHSGVATDSTPLGQDTVQTCMCDFRLPARCKLDFRSSGMLRSVQW